MEVFVADEQELPVDASRLSRLAHHVLSTEGVQEGAELSVLFVGDDHIRRLNSRFAGDDYSTDVLAFPMMDEEEDDSLMLGDVVICPKVAQTNARKMNHGLAEELDVLMVHGILHLLGYDHQGVEDKEAMDQKMKDLLRSFNQAALQ